MTGAFRTVEAVSLTQQVVDAIRDAITACRVDPGGKLIERELCETLGVSRGTIREGLRVLEAEGLVAILPHRGPQVVRLSRKSAEELYALRKILEGEAVAIAAETVNDETISELKHICGEMEIEAARNEFLALQVVKNRFYAVLFHASGNTEIEAMLIRLRARLSLVRDIDFERPARMAESIHGARTILDCLEARDSARARAAVHAHIERAAGLALHAFEQLEGKVETLSENSQGTAL